LQPKAVLAVSSRIPPKEGHLERLARRIVAEALGVEVTRYDDGSAPRQVDALIHLPSGSVPLEVVSDEDPAFEQQWAELGRRGHVIRTDLPSSWYVFLTNRGHVRELHAQLLRLPADWPWDGGADEYELPAALEKLGVADVVEAERIGADDRGKIVLSHQGWNSWDDPVELNEWVTRVLDRESDVAAKLELHGGRERHVFIWARPGSAWAVNSLLADDDDDNNEPVHGPALPAGITHVWVASTMTRRGCLVLENDRWRRTGWITIDPHADED
jgi:hypothetical protein